MRQRWRPALAVLWVVACLAATVLSWQWFVDPAGTASWGAADRAGWPRPGADAVVMFGGAGPRFDAARALVEAGLAPTLVLSDPNDPPAARATTPFEVFCRGEEDFETICFDPEPRTTRGESRFVASLARQRGWQRLVLVTTPDQARRARMLLQRCWPGEVDVVVVDSDLNPIGRVAYEWAATARAVFLRRSC